MPRRWGPGPVFVYESITAARRWQVYALRSAFVLVLLACLAFVWGSLDLDGRPAGSRSTLQQLARMGQRFYEVIAGTQLALILVAAPAATAGAVCLDRARGALAHLFVTDLSDAEIVLGKLAARLAPVVALVAAAVPVLAISTLLGGIIPEALASLFLVTLALAVLGCALAMAVSVRAAKAHEVLTAVYAVWAVWLLAAPAWLVVARAAGGRPPVAWFIKLNPFVLAYAPYESPGYVGAADLALFLALTLGASLGLVVVSVLRLRRELAPPARRWERWDAWAGAVRARLFSWWPSPGLDGNPVLWREWHRNRPSRLTRFIGAVYVALTIAGTSWGIHQCITQGSRNGPNLIMITNAFGVGFGLLVLSLTAPTALSEERVRGSLDVLMSTPIPTASIVLGKWWGVYRRVPLMAVLPALGALFAAASAPDLPWFPRGVQPTPVRIDTVDRVAAAVLPVAQILAYGAAVTSLGLALATWVARPGRALAGNVSAYLFLTVGWIVLVEAVILPFLMNWRGPARPFQETYWVAQGLVSLSPFGGQVTALEVLIHPFGTHRKWVWVMQAVEVLAALAFAAVALGLTVATFDRCLGRASERPSAPPRRGKPRTPGLKPAAPSPDFAGSEV